MLAYLEDPLESRRITVEDAMLVLPFYDKYQFPKGKELCGEVLSQFIEKENRTQELETLVDVVVLLDQVNLEARWLGIQLLCRRFYSVDSRVMFTMEQIKKLAPLIEKESDLLLCTGASKEEVLSPLFPELLVLRYEKFESRRLLAGTVPKILLSGTGFDDADGEFFQFNCWYIRERTWSWGGDEIRLSVGRYKLGDWEIAGRTTPRRRGW